MKIKRSEVKRLVGGLVGESYIPFGCDNNVAVTNLVSEVLGRLGISVVDDPPLPVGPLVTYGGGGVVVANPKSSFGGGRHIATAAFDPDNGPGKAFLSWAASKYNEERPWAK